MDEDIAAILDVVLGLRADMDELKKLHVAQQSIQAKLANMDKRLDALEPISRKINFTRSGVMKRKADGEQFSE